MKSVCVYAFISFMCLCMSSSECNVVAFFGPYILFFYHGSCLIFVYFNEWTSIDNGYLGSRNDEERSETRYVLRIAEFSESSNFRTHTALQVSWGMPSSVSSSPPKTDALFVSGSLSCVVDTQDQWIGGDIKGVFLWSECWELYRSSFHWLYRIFIFRHEKYRCDSFKGIYDCIVFLHVFLTWAR
jgi:hypothetical protein